jgi:thioredoxin-like negative regulator of GroEL
VPGAAEAFQGEYTRLRTMDEKDRAKAAADPAAPRKSRGVEPLEYDSDRPESVEMAWCLYGLARCALENSPSEPEAADQILGALRDKRRKNVIDKEVNLKAAVSRLALALDGDAGDGDALSAARRVFASGDVEGALDRALDAVKAASADDEREAARELCVTIIDAMGPGKESLRARKKLASVLF